MTEFKAPDSLKYQWRLLAIVLRSEWATGLDKTLAFEIIDNYRKDFGNSRASLSYLQKASGADRKAVIASTRRLTERGPFSVIRAGAGTRPTEYKLHFELAHENASSGLGTTTKEIESSSGVGTTTGGGVETTTSGSSSGAQTTETVLPVAAYKAGIQDRMIDCAPASPPPTVGPSGATAAGGAQGGFEQLWKTYFPRRGQGEKKKARAAYNKLNPRLELHAAMIDAAVVWYDAWAAQGKADAPRKHLDTWLTEELYECDPPTAYKAKEPKASKLEPAVAEATPEKPDFTIYPDEPATGTVERVEDYTDDEDGAKTLTVWYRTHDGQEIEQFLIYESPDLQEQDIGQAELRRLMNAVDLEEMNDADDLIGREVDLMINRGKFVSCSRPWAPAPSAPRNVPRFADVVDRTKPSGWALKIGQAYADDAEMDAA